MRNLTGSPGLNALWKELASESASWCGTSAARDIETVACRVEAEGESFFTITLPKFGKAFERALELGKIDHVPGFYSRKGLPEFLRGFLGQIFDPSGVLLSEPNIDSIRAVRQLTLVFGKIGRLCSKKRIDRAMNRFAEIEQELDAVDTDSLQREYFPLFEQASLYLWSDVMSHVENSMLGVSHLGDDWLSDEQSPRVAREDVFLSLTGLELSRAVDKFDGDPWLARLGLRPERPESSVGALLPTAVFGKGEPSGISVAHQLAIGEIVDPSRRNSFLPRHGPGATADGLRGNAKFNISSWPLRLERLFPYGEYALPQLACEDELDRVQFLEPRAEVPVKVTPVPKDDKTPRIIAEEPTAMQYMQQAFFHQLVYRLEEADEFPVQTGRKEFDLGRFFVGFKQQEPNRILAREGSRHGALATLDLSEASDRVLNEHVKLLFERFPRLSEGIQSTRSSSARLPDGRVLALRKFSSMGSALCFPIEAMVFTTLVFVAIAKELGVPVNRKLILDFRGKVRVYGDDIIVPVEYVPRVIQTLQAFGLVVNMDKSFWNGKFRESCGGDYYDGEWVTPIRLRQELPRSLDDVNGVVGLSAFRNLLYQSGYWKTAAIIDVHLNRLLKGRYKVIDATSAGIGRLSVLPYQADWMDKDTHDPVIAGAIVQHKIPKSKASGSGALLKFVLKRGILPSQDANHLERQGRPKSSRIVLRGVRPY